MVSQRKGERQAFSESGGREVDSFDLDWGHGPG
jgi:hypothetical protein